MSMVQVEQHLGYWERRIRCFPWRKRLKLAKGKIGSPDVEVLLKWNKVAERVRQLIRTDDFLSPEELEKYEERQEAQRQADLEGAQQALEVEQEGSDQQEIREEN